MNSTGPISWVACLFTILFLVDTASSCDESELRYLPKNVVLDPSIPSPKQHLGFRIGERHIQHHQLVSYLRKIARESPRIKLKVYAYSHGGRPCIMLTITSPANHKKLEGIQRSHRNLADPSQSSEVDKKSLPAVINMGYSVHGDESSASNAAVVVAYYLAAAKGTEVDSILKNCVILLDPCLNPDGLNRFASWANGHVGRIQNADPNHIEHNQPFPGGRVNYYWFDLNRDWLPAQHPESQGRLEQYHLWKPNVVLDFHEMSTNTSYFFQPGIPTRNNPLTPERTFELTNDLAKYHAKALDELGSLYMTEERFDDFYMGKGSTYPDLHGSVGILFEQASSRGHRQESINGELTFPFTIRNQVTTSLSSLRGTVALRTQLLQFKRDFFIDSLEQAKSFGGKQFEFRAPKDRSRLMAFARVLLRHDIKVFETRKKGESILIVPVHQPEFRFLLSLTEKRTQFKENVFYDVSTWHLPSAFGVEAVIRKKATDKSSLVPLTLESTRKRIKNKKKSVSGKPVAYVLDWRSQDASNLVCKLLRQGIDVRVAKKKFSIASNRRNIEFPHGTLMIPLGIQKSKTREIESLLNASSTPSFAVLNGLTPSGIDIGSNEFSPVKKQNVAMLVGDGVSRYEAGEVWHLFDTRLQHPLTMINTSRLGRTKLNRYTTLILVSGSYSTLSDKQIDPIKSWVDNGGNLVLCGSSISWAKSKGIVSVDLVDTASGTPETEVPNIDANNQEKTFEMNEIQRPFDQARNDRALKLISGAIFETNVDTTHPLGYGFTQSKLQVFRNNKVIVKPSKNPYSNAVVYTNDPQVAGYCSEENVNRLKNSAGAVSFSKGNGTIIVIPQNPNFRAFWFGTSRLFINAVFFGDHSRN